MITLILKGTQNKNSSFCVFIVTILLPSQDILLFSFFILMILTFGLKLPLRVLVASDNSYTPNVCKNIEFPRQILSDIFSFYCSLLSAQHFNCFSVSFQATSFMLIVVIQGKKYLIVFFFFCFPFGKTQKVLMHLITNHLMRSYHEVHRFYRPFISLI